MSASGGGASGARTMDAATLSREIGLRLGDVAQFAQDHGSYSWPVFLRAIGLTAYVGRLSEEDVHALILAIHTTLARVDDGARKARSAGGPALPAPPGRAGTVLSFKPRGTR
jgi:hypothetical protein